MLIHVINKFSTVNIFIVFFIYKVYFNFLNGNLQFYAILICYSKNLLTITIIFINKKILNYKNSI